MKKTNFKTVYILLAVSLVFLSALSFSSCGNGDKKRTAFSPESGAYEIMLNSDEWGVVTLFEDQYDQLGIIHYPSNTFLTIDCYTKSSLSDLGVSGPDGFIEFYKAFEKIKTLYEPGENKSFGDLTDIEKKDIKGSAAVWGKRQEFHIQNDGELVNELIYLETENYFLAILYANFADQFADSQKAANDALSHIKAKN